MKKLNFLVLIISVVLVSACELTKSKQTASTGRTNELLVVTNSEVHWNGLTGQAIKAFFGQYQVGLPQAEQMYDMTHIPQPSFSTLFETHHNIFIVDVNGSFTEPVIETKKDLWAKPQRVIKMTVPDEETFFKQFDLYKDAFIELFNENERTRANIAFVRIEDSKIRNQIRTNFDLDLSVPKGFRIVTITPNFAWIRRDADKFEQSIMIYYSLYTDTSNFNYEQLVSRRDSITKKYIPGPTGNSYMKVATIDPPVLKKIDFKGNFAVEMRGLWELQGDFMGGPFLSYTFVDERNNRIYSVDGFVYNPNENKKNLVRQLEAILYTLEIPKQAPAGSAN